MARKARKKPSTPPASADFSAMVEKIAQKAALPMIEDVVRHPKADAASIEYGNTHFSPQEAVWAQEAITLAAFVLYEVEATAEQYEMLFSSARLIAGALARLTRNEPILD